MLNIEKNKESLLRVMSLHLLFFTCLSYMYFFYIVPMYGYQGYVNNFNALKFCLAIISILMSTIFVGRTGKPSNFFLQITITLIISPSMVFYYGSDLPNEFLILILGSFFLMVLLARFMPAFRVAVTGIGTKVLLKFLSFLSIAFVISIFAFGGARFINFDFSLVYDLRRDAANNLPEIYMYLTSIFSKIIIPFAMVFALLNRNWLFLLLLSVSSILLFALTANKAPLFYPFLVVMIFFITEKKNIVSSFLIFSIAMVVLSIIDFSLKMNFDNPLYGWFGSVVGRRGFLVPSELNWLYYDYFSTHSYYLWSQSKIFMGLVNQPYDLSPANLIGQEFLGDADASANTGWIGSGFANAGFIGAFIYSVLIGCFFSFLDAYSKKLGNRVVITLFILPVMTIICSTDFLTMILTHGLAISILLLMTIKLERSVNKSEK